jgi:ABC-2 type transport system permease protein
MLFTIAGFEIRTRLKRVSTYVYFLCLFALACLWIAAAGGVFQSANVTFGAKVNINSPFAVAQTITVLGYLGLMIVTAIMGRAVQQDFESDIHHFFFTAPISKWQYLGGRFLGALVVLILVFSAIALGAVVAAALPGIDPDRLGPTLPMAYIEPYFTSVIPNLIFMGGCFFTLAALTRKMLPVYVATAVLLIGYLAASALLADLDNKTLAAMLDPFGIRATSTITRYWTISEKNNLMVPLTGLFLANRVLWTGLGVLMLVYCYFRFDYAHALQQGRPNSPADAVAVKPARISLPVLTPVFCGAYAWRMLPGMVRQNFLLTVNNVYFGVIVFAGALFLFSTATVLGSSYGTNTYPVTYQVLELTGGFFLFALIVITFYAGELVWRERDAGAAQILDALPIPTWLPFLAKLLALMLVQVLMLAVVMLCGILIQAFKGYFHFELGLYFHDLFGITLIVYLQLCVLAIAVQTLVNNKYLGHFVMVLYYISLSWLSFLGLEDRLYLYANTPEAPYSDMNGFGHFLGPVRWFDLYWTACALGLAVVSYLFWVRGSDTSLAKRFALARARFTSTPRVIAAFAVLVFAGSGAFIYYNTHVLHPYRSEYDMESLAADYETKYKSELSIPQPKVTDVKVNVDLYPYERRANIKGRFLLVNKTAAPISLLHTNLNQDPGTAGDLIVHSLSLGRPFKQIRDDEVLGVRSFQFETPLQPGESTTLDFDLELAPQGFRNAGSDTAIVYNGTFFNSFLLPRLGYDDRLELSEDRQRKKHGLQPKERMRDLNDPVGLARNYISGDADWIDFDATVSTSPDQIAIAPGYLQKEWTEGERRYFHYKMDSKILDFYAFLSARYAVKQDHWNDVAIAVYYQPGHEYNLERMVDSVKASLEYYTKHFGPYQHKQVRILEFPRYERFAQSFPNTIPFSEAIGFIAKVDPASEKDVDYPYYVTAHEVAHQWWAHQVVGGYVQGATMLSETLAQYSALMVMKQKYGADKMKRFLKYELDNYLLGRALERKKELPLYRVENQGYIHYRKGSVVMYALQDYIGEDKVNQALAAYRAKVAFQNPPYTNTPELIGYLRQVTPPQLQYVIDDMIESITLFENRAVEATYRKLPDGKFEVKLKVAAKKMKADERGAETEVALADWIDIGVLDEAGKPLYLEKKKIDKAEMEFDIVVDRLPAKAGIDPFNKLIDRRPDDNVIDVSRSDATESAKLP